MTASPTERAERFDLTAAKQEGWTIHEPVGSNRARIISIDKEKTNADAQLHVMGSAISGSRYHLEALRLVNIKDPEEFGKMRELGESSGKNISMIPGQSDIWLMLDKSESDHLYRLISQNPDDVVLAGIAAKMEILSDDIQNDDAFRSAASDAVAGKFSDGDACIDDNAMVSKGENGAYVMTFVYVRNAEAGLEFDEDDEPDGEDDDYPSL